jgi:two-component system NtrC family sensor kinase
MALKLLVDFRGSAGPSGPVAQVSPYGSMNRDFQTRFTAGLLFLLTVTACVFAWINFQKEHEFQVPYDGAWWVEHGGKLVADHVERNGPADKGGIRKGDILRAINGREVNSAPGLERQLYANGVWKEAKYTVLRHGIELESIPVVLSPAERPLNDWLRLIALIYLGIGIYVLLRRWTAPSSTHFYIFCLVSFIFYSFHYTGKLNAFDWSVYWSNVGAWMLQPALFLHFVLTFPERRHLIRRHRWLLGALYVPGLALLGIHIFTLLFVQASEFRRWNLDRLWWSYLALYFVASAAVLWYSYLRASNPTLRQQLKWVTRGTVVAIAPTMLYIVPYLLGYTPPVAMKVSVLSLGLLPLTFGYAIFRYRLMDVDLIFKRGMIYTLAAAAVVMVYFAVVAGVAELVHTRIPSTGPYGLILAMVVTALLFDPVRKWIQDGVDQFFYRTRYDYRKTLIEFGRELSAETDLDEMLSSVVDRLSRTLLVDRLAIFLATGEETDHFVLAKSFGITQTSGLDLSFLSAQRPELEAGHIFFDNTHQVPRETPDAQNAIAKLDLNYYIPCRVQRKPIAVLGLGKTMEGDFLTSEDVELLETLAGYIGIAMQNARLYASLEQKVAEYERLKDFNENIVESINVGVLAVDLADRIESWNSQMEVMYALPRWQALTRPLSEVFPAEFVEEFYRVRQNPGIHNLYKFRLNTPAGEVRTINAAIAPLVTRKFNVIGRLIIMDDITERVELEAQLAQSDKLSSIGLLAAGVAHEVNTPLAVISSYTQMLSKQLKQDSQKAALLEKITRQTFRASEIVSNLLNFSRTSGAEFGNVDVNKVVTDTLALLDHQLKTSRIAVESDLTPQLPPIQGNTGRLQQVFLNLFLNAKDAMPGGGTLRVVTSNGTGVTVTVTDTGSGIAPEHIARIYDPFFTTKTAPEKRGTGLGLSVTYGIIQEHAGKIRVESRPGEGTTFYLDFPLTRKAVNV